MIEIRLWGVRKEDELGVGGTWGSYAVVVLDGLRDERVDKER